MTNSDAHASDFLVFGRPAIGDAEIGEVVDTLRSGWLSTGPKVARFEEEFASYQHAEHAIAVGSCTAALHLSLIAAGVGAGDEVITTPMTFCATVNAILHAGATPVLADVDPVTMNLDPERVEEKIGARTRAIVPVHFAGRACEMDALGDIARQHDLRIIEDCAHAIETRLDGRAAGTFGDFGCFSFYATKNLATGEGGMALARRAEDAERVRELRLHGMSKGAWKRYGGDGFRHYDVVACGYKYNMMDIQAAIGLRQLERVEEMWQRRREIWARYNDAFAGLPLERPAPPAPNTRHAYHLYTVLIDPEESGLDREAFLDAMTRRGIGVGVHYRAIPEHTYYRERFGWRAEHYPNAARIGRRTVSLPLSPGMSDGDVERVLSAVRLVLEGARRPLAA